MNTSTLSDCAEWHEREASRWNELMLVAIEDCNESEARYFEEQKELHARFGVVCRLADVY